MDIRLLIASAVICTLFVSSLSQDRETKRVVSKNSEDRNSEQGKSKLDSEGVLKLVRDNPHWFASSRKFSSVVKSTKRDRELITVAEEDVEAYSRLLQLPNTGAVRLHDIARCERLKKYVVNVNCTWDVIGKAASFSFRTGKYSFGLYSDIQYRNGEVEVYGLNLLGFVTELGDVPLSDLELESEGIRQMAEFEPSTKIRDVVRQIGIAKKGFIIGKYFYSTRSPLKINTTYAVRSIAYRADWDKQLRKVVEKVLGKDKRLDVTAVFRVLRKHEDGSANILWKTLRKNAAPKISS